MNTYSSGASAVVLGFVVPRFWFCELLTGAVFTFSGNASETQMLFAELM